LRIIEIVASLLGPIHAKPVAIVLYLDESYALRDHYLPLLFFGLRYHFFHWSDRHLNLLLDAPNNLCLRFLMFKS